MKITSKRTKTGATIRISARSNADRAALTKAVMSGELFKALNGGTLDRKPEANGKA